MEIKNRLLQFLHDLTLFVGVLGYGFAFLFYLGQYQFMVQKIGTSTALVVNAVTFEEVQNARVDRYIEQNMGKRR